MSYVIIRSQETKSLIWWLVWYGLILYQECHWLVAASKCTRLHKIEFHGRSWCIPGGLTLWMCKLHGAACLQHVATRYYPTLALFCFFCILFLQQQDEHGNNSTVRLCEGDNHKELRPFWQQAWWCFMMPDESGIMGLYMCAFLRTMTTPHHSIAKKNLTWPWPCLVSIWNIAWLCLTDNNNCSLSNSATQCVLLSGHGLSALWQQDVHILLIRSRCIVFMVMCVFFLMCVCMCVCVGRCCMRTHNMMNMHEYAQNLNSV